MYMYRKEYTDMAMSRKVRGQKPALEQTKGVAVRSPYGRKASKASPAKHSEPVCDSNTHITV